MRPITSTPSTSTRYVPVAMLVPIGSYPGGRSTVCVKEPARSRAGSKNTNRSLATSTTGAEASL
ncbi:MAG TPA: hypothetical protein VHF47_01880 [Acidimicrobiales bacterium]|nr:hypothetical protein [Acidimicrobiales bacterium]